MLCLFSLPYLASLLLHKWLGVWRIHSLQSPFSRFELAHGLKCVIFDFYHKLTVTNKTLNCPIYDESTQHTLVP